MAIAITKYRASDGTEHTSMEKAEAHEALIASTQAALLPLGEHSINGRCYWQHTKEACLQAKRNLLAIIRPLYNVETWPVFKFADDEIHPLSFVGRLLDDTAPGPINEAWGRLCRINWESFRQYEQPYYANNPDEANECLNPEPTPCT